jgi:hypothetical protein
MAREAMRRLLSAPLRWQKRWAWTHDGARTSSPVLVSSTAEGARAAQ